MDMFKKSRKLENEIIKMLEGIGNKADGGLT